MAASVNWKTEFEEAYQAVTGETTTVTPGGQVSYIIATNPPTSLHFRRWQIERMTQQMTQHLRETAPQPAVHPAIAAEANALTQERSTPGHHSMVGRSALAWLPLLSGSKL